MLGNNLDDILSNKAAGFRLEPSPGAFAGVMGARRREKRRRLFWYLFPAALIAITGLALLANVYIGQQAPLQPAAIASNGQASQAAKPELRPMYQNNATHTSTQAEAQLQQQTPDPAKAAMPEVPDPITPKAGHSEREHHDPTTHSVSPSVERSQIEPGIAAPTASLRHTKHRVHSKAVTQAALAGLAAGQLHAGPVKKEDQRNEKQIREPVKTAAINEHTDPVEPTIAKAEQASLNANAAKDSSSLTQASATIKALQPDTAAAIVRAAPDTLPAAPGTKFADAHQPKWIVSAVFTPQVISSVYSANSDADISWLRRYLDNRQENDKARVCYNAGIRIERMLGKHFSVGSGAFVSVIRFEEIKMVNKIEPYKATTVNMKPNVAEAYDMNAVTVLDRNRFDISFTSLEVPLMLSYYQRLGKVRLQASAGVAYSYLVKTRSLVFDNKDSLNVKETDDAKNSRLQQHNFMLVTGVNAGIDIGKRWNVYAGPVFRYQLNSLYSKEYVLRQQPYFIGGELGLRFYF